MEKMISFLDNLYMNKVIKNTYLIFFISLTIFLFIFLPFFLIGNTFQVNIIQCVIRLFFTISCSQGFYFVSHQEKAYAQFYKGSRLLPKSEPDSLKKILNIFSSFFGGFIGFLVYQFALATFYPFLGNISLLISITIGLFIMLPLLSQYNKR